MLEINLNESITQKTTRTLVERDLTKVYPDGNTLILTLSEDYDGDNYYEIVISAFLQESKESSQAYTFYLPTADYSSYNNDIDVIKCCALHLIDHLFNMEAMTVAHLRGAGFYFD